MSFLCREQNVTVYFAGIADNFGKVNLYAFLDSSLYYPFAFLLPDLYEPGKRICIPPTKLKYLQSVHAFNMSGVISDSCNAGDFHNLRNLTATSLCLDEFVSVTYLINPWSITLVFTTMLAGFALLVGVGYLESRKQSQTVNFLSLLTAVTGILLYPFGFVYAFWASFTYYPDTDFMYSFPIFLFSIIILVLVCICGIFSPFTEKEESYRPLKSSSRLMSNPFFSPTRQNPFPQDYTAVVDAMTTESFLKYTPGVDEEIIKQKFEIEKILFMSHKWPSGEKDTPVFQQLENMKSHIKAIGWKGGVWLDWMMVQDNPIIELSNLLADRTGTPQFYICQVSSEGYYNSLWCRLEYAMQGGVSNETITHLSFRSDLHVIEAILDHILRNKRSEAVELFRDEMYRFKKSLQ